MSELSKMVLACFCSALVTGIATYGVTQRVAEDNRKQLEVMWRTKPSNDDMNNAMTIATQEHIIEYHNGVCK